MKILAQNRKARHNYFIEDEYDAGIVLLGSEIKSIRSGKSNIQDAMVDFSKDGELFLANSFIAPFEMANRFNHEPNRKRKLLLHRKEINKIMGKMKIGGITVVPLLLFLNDRNIAKVRIAIAKGKKLYDKRESIKEKDLRRDKEISIKHNFR